MHGPEDFVFGLSGGRAFSPMKRAACILILSFAFFFSGCGQKSYVIIPDIRQAPEFVSEGYLAFTGTPRTDLAGTHSWSAASVGPNRNPGTRKLNHRYVVPVVPKDWDKSQPVPLWVSFSNNKRDQRQELGALKAAMAAGQIRGQKVDFPERTVGVVRGKSAWQSAVENAEQTHGIRSDPRAPIVSWRPRG